MRFPVLLAALAAAFGLASCGGGDTNNAGEDFHADRVLSFGDETSVIVDLKSNANGYKYSVNAVLADNTAQVDCNTFRIWNQEVAASNYGLYFPQCNPLNVVSPSSRIRAALGARAADLATQINAQIDDSPIRDGDLATVLVGANDVIALYQQYPAVGQPDLVTAVEAAGAETGRQVNRLRSLGAHVIVSTIPDVGYSPYALAEKAANTDTDRQQILLALVERFNASLRATIENDGTRIGLVQADIIVQNAVRANGYQNITNPTTGVCDISKSALVPKSILDCTTLTLIPDGSATAYLWADDRHLGWGGQRVLGLSASERARANPF